MSNNVCETECSSKLQYRPRRFLIRDYGHACVVHILFRPSYNLSTQFYLLQTHSHVSALWFEEIFTEAVLTGVMDAVLEELSVYCIFVTAGAKNAYLTSFGISGDGSNSRFAILK